jgi:hypothetical protein
MKRFCFLFLVLSMCICQVEGQLKKAGGSFGFTTGFPFHQVSLDANKSGHIVVSGKGIYELNLPFEISPSITFLSPHITKGTDTKTSVSALMLDFNGHYIFSSQDILSIYGIAGIDILMAWKKEVRTLSTSTTVFRENDNSLGLNIGAGTIVKVTEKIDFFVESKYILSRNGQLIINAGILLNINTPDNKVKTGR